MPGSPSSPPPHHSSSHLLAPSPISSDVDKSLLSSPRPLPESTKYDPSCSDMEKPPDQVQPPPASLSALVFPPCPFSPEIQNITHSQSPTLPSPAVFIPLSTTSSPMQDASTIRGSEDIQTEDKDAPSSNLSTLPHDSKGVACPPFSSVSPSPSPNLDCPFSASIVMSSSKSDSSSGSPGNTQSKWTEGILHENSLSASGIISSPHPSSNNLPPSAYLDLNCLSFFSESFSQSPENKSKESVFSDSVGKGLFQEPNKTQKEQDEAPSFLSFQLDKDNPSAPSPPALDSFEFEDAHHTLSCLSRETFIPFCLSAESSLPHPDLDRIDPAAGRISELREQSISQQGQSCSHNDIADLTTSSTVQEVIHAKMHIEDSLKRNRKGEGERHTDSVQTQDSVVCISDTESSAGLLDCSRLASVELCHQTEIDPHVLLCSQREEFLAVTKQEELRRVCQMEINGTQSESPRSYFILNELSETQSGASMEAEDLTKNESLDLVFETSVDGMEGENGDVDAFFEQLATEGQVYWAEPIQVLSPTHDGSPGNSWLPLDSATLDSISTTGNALPLSLSSSATVGSDQNSRNTTASPDTPSSTTLAPFLSPPETPNLRLPRRSVSVQISSSLSSHIVHRKDVPYVADSKRTLVPSVFSLDTSDPFRAVQAWTDMQIQRNMEKLSCTVPNEVGATEMTQKSPLIFASSPSFPLLSNDCQLHDCFPGMVGKTASVSVDTGLGPDKEEEVYRNGTRDKENLWEGNPSVTMACCCSCDHQCSCCRSYNRQHTLGNVPLSLGDLEEMMLCLQHFRLVHSNIEEQLSEDHVSLHRALSDQDRENIRDLEVLRRAVKQEAAELEVHLNHLVHYYDDSLKM
ncbi:uncharacterized protein LOC118291080 isoform X2 [Scophthalmus maximus]|nr:uncharacterized protein LOC118291080 isoform X2 [Scophthalmus maximus]